MWDAASGSHVWRSASCQRLLRAYSVCAPGAPEAQTKYSRYVDAVRFQTSTQEIFSALRIIDLRNFFAKRKEVTNRESICDGVGEARRIPKDKEGEWWDRGQREVMILERTSMRRRYGGIRRDGCGRFSTAQVCLAPLLRQLATAAAKWPRRAPGPVPTARSRRRTARRSQEPWPPWDAGTC
jgi:hypothetical protein